MGPLMLIILDGLGLGKDYKGNAFKLANTPNIDKIFKEFPHTSLYASGEEVGLPDGQIGNSEVGHLNIGAGRIVYQDLTRINKAIKNRDFFKEESFIQASKYAKDNYKKVHLIGLTSYGGVHSHMDHLKALIEFFKAENVKDLYIHSILDGRDVDPKIAQRDIRELDEYLKEINYASIASIIGRYYAMDRDKKWDRTKIAYDLYTKGIGEKANNPAKWIEDNYKKDITDEFVKPALIDENGLIEKGDIVLFFNFRPDRMRQIVEALSQEDFTGFEIEKDLNLKVLTMTQYNEDFKDLEIIYKPEDLKNTLGEVISDAGLKQLRTAETEKYAHVTFFFNGGIEEANKGEDRLLINSPQIATYDLKPEMSAIELTDNVVKKLKDYDLIILNYANPDMVGHTGDLDATIKAIETVDSSLNRIFKKLDELNGRALITSDHGNSEEMITEDGKMITAHSVNKVPFIYYNGEGMLRDGGRLSDISPTILDILNIDKPVEMTGETLIVKEA